MCLCMYVRPARLMPVPGRWQVCCNAKSQTAWSRACLGMQRGLTLLIALPIGISFLMTNGTKIFPLYLFSRISIIKAVLRPLALVSLMAAP